MSKFSDKEVADWEKYEKVRKSGLFNMFDPRAQRSARLNDDEYLLCMKHYIDLKKQWEEMQ